MCLRYGFDLVGLPTSCICDTPKTTDHALTCPFGGYPMAQHDNGCDVLACVSRDAVREVKVEPQLLPLDNEDLPGRITNRSAAARFDI